MKFRVTGQNRETGARQTLEFEADSKGAAERKADKAGMSVNHAELVTEGYEPPAETSSSRSSGGGMGKAIGWIIVIAAVGLIVMNWARIKGMMGK